MSASAVTTDEKADILYKRSLGKAFTETDRTHWEEPYESLSLIFRENNKILQDYLLISSGFIDRRSRTIFSK